METSGGILARVSERILYVIGLGLLVLAGYAVYRLGPDGRAALWSGIGRTVAFIALAAAVPWAARFFMRRLLAVGENWVGAVLVSVLTLVDAIIGRVLMQGWPQSGWGWIAALAILAVLGTYNYLVAEYLAEQTGG